MGVGIGFEAHNSLFSPNIDPTSSYIFFPHPHLDILFDCAFSIKLILLNVHVTRLKEEDENSATPFLFLRIKIRFLYYKLKYWLQATWIIYFLESKKVAEVKYILSLPDKDIHIRKHVGKYHCEENLLRYR